MLCIAEMPMRVADLYERHAHAFDFARRKQFAEQPWLDRFLAPLPAHGHVLDLGCGAGEPIARYLMDRGFHVMGVDTSDRMIALCRTRFPRERWLQADMRKAIMDRTFDGVIAWDSLFHLTHDDQAEMIRRIAGWLNPGGSLLFSAGPERGEAVGSLGGEDLYHYSLAPDEYRALFQGNGLIEIDFTPQDMSCGGRSIWLARKR